jgi:hypothetical protein
VHESWKEERKIWSGIPFSKPSQSVKPCLLFSFLFFPMIPSRYHGKKREKNAWTFHFFKTFTIRKNHASYLISFFPHDTVCTNHGKKREKYGKAFHFSKTPPQVEEKIS